MKIFIDIGHNPHTCDTGTSGNNMREFDVTYEVGTRLAKKLASVGFETAVSHETPNTILGATVNQSLAKRTQKANNWNADYYISLHCDGSPVATPKGAHICVYNTKTESEALAIPIINKLLSLGLEGRGTHIQVRQDLYVLKNTHMPAILIEMGFLTNPEDAKILQNQELLAQTIFEGICQRFNINTTKEIITVNDIVWELSVRGIISDKELWLTKLENDSNDYWLARKIIKYLIEKGV